MRLAIVALAGAAVRLSVRMAVRGAAVLGAAVLGAAVLGAAVLGAAVLGAASGGTAAAAGVTAATSPAAESPAAKGPAAKGPEVSLLEQSTWVTAGKTFDLRIGLPAGLASTDQIVVTAYSRLNSRSYFDQAAELGGQTGEVVWSGEEGVADAPRARSGGVWARIPVVTAPVVGDLETGEAFDPGDESGVYPVRVQIIDSAYVSVGASLPTFLVYSANQSSFKRLATSITVPVTSTPVLSSHLDLSGPTASTSSRLAALSTDLISHPGVDVNLAVTPQTTQALAAGSATDRATLGRLGALVRLGDELLPEPYVPVSLAGLDAAGLDLPGVDQLTDQLRTGAQVLNATLGSTPTSGTWVIADSVDDSTVQHLYGEGLREVILPDDDVTGLPSSLTTTTYGRPTALDDGGDGGIRVVTTDPTLESRMTQGTGPVLAAEQTLAELAMIELELPSEARGVAITLPADGSASGLYLSTLLGGLRANPFVRTVTAAGMFSTVPDVVPAGTQSSSAGITTADPTSPTTTAAPAAGKIPVRNLRALPLPVVADSSEMQSLQGQIAGLASLLPTDGVEVGRLRQQLLVAPAAGLSEALRGALLGSMATVIQQAETSVSLPGNTSVTLTSLRATVPLTIISNPKLAPHVRLSLESPKLSFRAYRPPDDGSCTITSRTSEVCDLVLHGPDTDLRVPVEARTSGVFFLDVGLASPDGTLSLASARDTVRSTAVSFVGIVIIVGALLLLATWWIRDIRSGRRARQLVQRPGDDIDDDGGPPDGGTGPEPPSSPVGPAEPVTPPGLLVPSGSATVGGSAPVGGSAVMAGAGRDGPEAHRGRHHARHRRGAPTNTRRMSPTERLDGPIRRADDPPEEQAP